MDIKKVLSALDHTLLSPTAKERDFALAALEAAEYKVAAVCVPPAFVPETITSSAGRVSVAAVVGFPNGYNTLKTKLFEAGEALKDGAAELDFVININKLKSRDLDGVATEIRALRALAEKKIIKIIVETCLLTDVEKAEICKIVSAEGADFIKTSTGFSKGGAVPEDILLFKRQLTGGVRIKASGGIKTVAEAEKFLSLGAERIGASGVLHNAIELGLIKN
jgi:deoxyribose-phosphate aldolase